MGPHKMNSMMRLRDYFGNLLVVDEPASRIRTTQFYKHFGIRSFTLLPAKHIHMLKILGKFGAQKE